MAACSWVGVLDTTCTIGWIPGLSSCMSSLVVQAVLPIFLSHTLTSGISSSRGWGWCTRGHLAILIDEALQGEDDCKVLPGVADHHGVADHLLHSGAAASPRSQGPP